VQRYNPTRTQEHQQHGYETFESYRRRSRSGDSETDWPCWPTYDGRIPARPPSIKGSKSSIELQISSHESTEPMQDRKKKRRPSHERRLRPSSVDLTVIHENSVHTDAKLFKAFARKRCLSCEELSAPSRLSTLTALVAQVHSWTPQRPDGSSWLTQRSKLTIGTVRYSSLSLRRCNRTASARGCTDVAPSRRKSGVQQVAFSTASVLSARAQSQQPSDRWALLCTSF
jgi:hypothetical protein